jgi:hypothetical protein
MVGSLVRSVYAPRRRSAAAASAERTLAVLVGARAVLERGWVQGGWYVLEAPDGRRRFVVAGSLTRRSFGEIVQSCLVGAVVEAARWHTSERGAAGPAIDTLWQELGELSSSRPPIDPRTPIPVLRSRQVGDLTTWNDRRGRSRDEVLALLDAAIARVTPTRVAPSEVGGGPSGEGGQISSPSRAEARAALSVGTGR